MGTYQAELQKSIPDYPTGGKANGSEHFIEDFLNEPDWLLVLI